MRTAAHHAALLMAHLYCRSASSLAFASICTTWQCRYLLNEYPAAEGLGTIEECPAAEGMAQPRWLRTMTSTSRSRPYSTMGPCWPT